jgi:flavin reductase (DIM6/NTAB) family NADH-FMN oxidoreductase RutF
VNGPAVWSVSIRRRGIDPEHYCFWLSKANHTYRVALRFRAFSPSISPPPRTASWPRFFGSRSGSETDKFAGLDFTVTEDGVPLLADLPNRLIVERITMLDDGGDHVCLTARVIAIEFAGGFTALRPSQLGDLTPGHNAEERAIRP